ncbi:MAG TPA: SDR family oxidoreductase [Streptosporangiaceae bacterium]|nr:SDR family oxidoreductase [Streptosporangiaceae bacterium]
MGALDGKGALVTGGSRGIGRAIVKRLAADGAAVVFSYRQNEAAAADVVREVAADGGRIIAISTLNTRLHPPGGALYTGAKGALENFTKVAAIEFGRRGIAANVVSPGATDTEMLRAANPGETFEDTAARTALRRLGQPEDIAAVVAFLAGPDSGWISGQNLAADGGLLP